MSAEVDACLAALPEDQRACLSRLRAVIARLLPGATEVISHAMPGGRHPSGRMVAGCAAIARHPGLCPQFRRGHAAPRGGLHRLPHVEKWHPLHPSRLLPDTLVRRILDLRLAEIAALAKSSHGH